VSAPPATVAQLRSERECALVPSELEIVDDSAAHAGHAGAREGGHYKVRVVAEVFRGRSQLERHRLVYGTVATLMARAVHALNIVARAPGESP